MAEQDRLAANRFAMRAPSLADRAVAQMDSATNQRDYITSRGAALANGWRPESADGNLQPAPVQPSAPAPVAATSSSASSASSSSPTPAGPVYSSSYLAQKFLNENKPHLSFAYASRLPQGQWLDMMEEYNARRDQEARDRMRNTIEEANRRFRESQMASAPAYVPPSQPASPSSSSSLTSSSTGAPAASNSSNAATSSGVSLSSSINWKKRRSKRGMSALRTYPA